MRPSLFLLFCLIASSAYASFPRCALLMLPSMEPDLQTARPTQGGIGLRQVDKKQKKIQGFDSESERHAYFGATYSGGKST